jgi:hypothetical protein
VASISEALNSKPPLASALEAGVKALSMDQRLSFSLYQRYVFPLDGMNYWIKLPSVVNPITTPGIQTYAGLVTETAKDWEAIQVVPGGNGAINIVGGIIVNPLDSVDQGLGAAESLFVDFTGPAYSYVTGTTRELVPGESIDIPVGNPNGTWVCAPHGKHKFTCVIYKSVPSVVLPTDVEVQGSFHYASAIEQREDATVDSNDLIFTSLSEIQPFNLIGPDHLYIARYHDLVFAFSSRARLYEQADLYHYQGKALFSTNATQIIDDPSQFKPTLVISNSLPIWLSLSSYVPPYPTFDCPFPLYPSYLVDDNLKPPFGSVHIEETKALAMAPYMGPKSETGHLCRDTVKVHLYGLSNEEASNFLLCVENYSRDWMTIGMANSPYIKDEKHSQPEMKILAKRKSIEFEVNYLQSVVRSIVRQFILHARVQFYDPQWFVQPKGTPYAADNSASPMAC